MAISFRRALISYRNLHLFRCRTTSRHLSYLVNSSSNFHVPAPSHGVSTSPENSFLLESRRSFAKGRRQRDEDDNDMVTATQTVNIGPSVKAGAISQMEAAIDALSRELAKLRTGRASPGMLDHIMVETHGTKMPLSRMAVVSVLDSKTLSINPYDSSTLKELEKAITNSPLGINPKPDGERLIAPIPPLTKEHMQAVCKVVSKSSEDAKQSIRRARQKALDVIKKASPKKKDKDKSASGLSEDAAKRLEKEIDDLTKKFIKSAEDMSKAKEKEISAG